MALVALPMLVVGIVLAVFGWVWKRRNPTTRGLLGAILIWYFAAMLIVSGAGTFVAGIASFDPVTYLTIIALALVARPAMVRINERHGGIGAVFGRVARSLDHSALEERVADLAHQVGLQCLSQLPGVQVPEDWRVYAVQMARRAAVDELAARAQTLPSARLDAAVDRGVAQAVVEWENRAQSRQRRSAAGREARRVVASAAAVVKGDDRDGSGAAARERKSRESSPAHGTGASGHVDGAKVSRSEGNRTQMLDPIDLILGHVVDLTVLGSLGDVPFDQLRARCRQAVASKNRDLGEPIAGKNLLESVADEKMNAAIERAERAMSVQADGSIFFDNLAFWGLHDRAAVGSRSFGSVNELPELEARLNATVAGLRFVVVSDLAVFGEQVSSNVTTLVAYAPYHELVAPLQSKQLRRDELEALARAITAAVSLPSSHSLMVYIQGDDGSWWGADSLGTTFGPRDNESSSYSSIPQEDLRRAFA